MTTPLKIGVLFNVTEKSALLLKGLRRRYPEAHVVAVVPERAAPAPEDMEAAAAKITSKGNHNIVLTERGTSFGYHNLIVDFRSFQIMKQFGFPVVYDVTHSLQRPSNSAISGGNPEFVPMMGKAALATNMVNGIFLETHPEPAKAKSDSQSMIKLESISDLLDSWQKTKE